MEETAVATLSQLLQSLQPYPQMQFLLFADRWGALERELLRFAEEQGHGVLLYALEGQGGGSLPTSEALRHRPYRIEQPRYNLQGRLYNHAFVFAGIPDDPETFARKVYTGIANAGGLYLLMEREDPDTRHRWEAALLESNYVATSAIPLDEERLLLYGRKMHGWGG